MMRNWIWLLAALFLTAGWSFGQTPAKPVYVVLWFDTEDFVDPRSDDAAMELATRLTRLGVRATFKVVGEKARVLEARGRRDVIEALRLHDIGSHGNYHSLHPAPSEYLEYLSLPEGADQFYAHEISGVREVKRIFGQSPSCYGQPGGSFAPHTFLAFPRLGIPAYFDSASQVGLESDQPFFLEGIFTMLNRKDFLVRWALNSPEGAPEGRKAFDNAWQKLQDQGGGLISTVYHPTEFVNAEFWDAVNFSKGANPDRPGWKLPRARTPQEIRRGYEVLEEYVRYARSKPGVQFITVTDALRLYADNSEGRTLSPAEIRELAGAMSRRLDYARKKEYALSAAEIADLLLRFSLLPESDRTRGVAVRAVKAPVALGRPAFTGDRLTGQQWREARTWALEFINETGRLPSQVWFGVESMPVERFVATLAHDLAQGDSEPGATLQQAECGFCGTVNPDDQKPFGWVIHPEGFRGRSIQELTKLIAWSIKPAMLPAGP